MAEVYFFIKSELNHNVIDISGKNTAQGTPLVSWPQINESGNANQLWTLSPSNLPGWAFIKSKLNGFVIDIKDRNTARATPLVSWPQKASDNSSQLWAFHEGYIISKLNGLVIDISGISPAAGAPLHTWPRRTPYPHNQLKQNK